MSFFSQNLILLNGSTIEKTLDSFNPLQWIWNLRIGREEYVSHPAFPVVITVSSYFILCTLFMVIDFLGEKTNIFQKYKIQNDVEVTWPMVVRAVKHTLLNNFLLILPATIAQCIWVPITPMPSKAPSLYEFFSQILIILMIFDFQYWVWHTVHHKIRWLYRNFHAIHHQYHSTFSWTTQYLHPWELFTVGFFTTVDGWFFECHPMTYWGFMLLNVFASIESHSGFDFPLALSKVIPFGIYGGSRKHDMHHMRPLTNFQPYFSTWDRLVGWECPGLKAGKEKCKELIDWENKNKTKKLNKYAFQLMKGTENGLLFPKELNVSEIRLKYD